MCGRKRRNTGSTARISALDAPMALNWLAAAQVALLLILTDNSAALSSYSATICLASRAGLTSRVRRTRLDRDRDGLSMSLVRVELLGPASPFYRAADVPVAAAPVVVSASRGAISRLGRRGARGRRRPRQARDRCALGPRPQGPQIRLGLTRSVIERLLLISRASPAARSEESGESSIPESCARTRPWRAPQPQHKMAADRLPPSHAHKHPPSALRARVQ